MCGIIGVTGSPDAVAVLLDGLARLEYRGYDSAGVALQVPSGLWIERSARGTESLADLGAALDRAPGPCSAGIGHTRWATHGRPSEVNAHPHRDCTGAVAVVHNGIIENHFELAAELSASGHELVSDTDSEVLAHLIEASLADGKALVDAVRACVRSVRGSLAMVAVHSADPALLVAARRVSPLIVATTDLVGFVASDVPALLGRADVMYVLEDGQVAEVRPGEIRVVGADGEISVPAELKVDWDLTAAQKGGFDNFMLKEIHEQPAAVADTLMGRLSPGGTVLLDEMRIDDDELREVEKVFIVACGSSYHAGLVAKYAMEHWARMAVEIDIASEFRYRDPILDSRTLVVGVSQSGETLDTLQAIRYARRWNAKVLVVTNVVDSSMAREADGVFYTRAGPEIGVAATKTFLAQLVALETLSLYLAGLRGTLYPAEISDLLDSMQELPAKVASALGRSEEVFNLAAAYAASAEFFFIGRHVGYPVALEGALKLKEISYLHAEGYPAGELKHGPIALLEEGSIVVGIATRTRLWEKMMANIAEVRARGAVVVLVANEGDEETGSVGDATLWVPSTHPLFAPVLDVIPLQLFAYALARARGNDVDRPRNLAKTVTVE
ncbi:MAG: glutamine--fructose-6-phosphate transaminase (isomerizing) [Acidimicrobiales bacterium]